MFPEWKISAEATYGSPAWELLARADEFKPDLIVAGSHGHSAISRFFLGSISQKILTEAYCSVRIARGKIETDPGPLRLIVGFDGSKGAKAAVDSVVKRAWPQGTAVRLVAATENISPSAIGRFIPPIANIVDEANEYETEWIEKLAVKELADLRTAGVNASLEARPGNPKKVLIEEAEAWNADCIFVGANAFGSRLERFLLGSTSAAVAARAHCSVEVTRR
jgi:nucleotide-binding universal stress UspA family protein